jgi:hypothetical protein
VARRPLGERDLTARFRAPRSALSRTGPCASGFDMKWRRFFGFAQDAVSLRPLSKAAQQVFLSFASSELFKQRMASLVTADRRPVDANSSRCPQAGAPGTPRRVPLGGRVLLSECWGPSTGCAPGIA